MDSALPVVDAVIAALKADVDVTALVAARVYTDVPQAADFPYIVVSVQSQPFAAQDFSGQSHTVRIQAFSQKSSISEALGIRAAAHAALDRQEGSLTLSAGTLVKCEYSGFSDALREDDGKTWQAVSEFEVVVV